MENMIEKYTKGKININEWGYVYKERNLKLNSTRKGMIIETNDGDLIVVKTETFISV
jgi:hypothetical protein